MILPVSGAGSVVKTRQRGSERLARETFDRFARRERATIAYEAVGSLRTFGQERVQGTGAGTPIVFAASGFAVLGWLLIVGGRFQMALAHDAEYKRYMRETTLLQRLSGYSPPLLPPFSIDMRWLLGGVANSAAALFLAIIIPSQFLLAWGETLVGAFMIVASAGGFSPKRPEDASESQRTTD